MLVRQPSASDCTGEATTGEATMKTVEFTLPLYEDILEFLAGGPSIQQVVEYRPSAAAQQRFSALLEADRQRELSLSEEEELDHYVRMDRMLSLLKAKSYRRLANARPA